MSDFATPRQIGIYCFLMLFCGKIILLPSIIFKEVKESSVLLFLILFIIDLIILIILLFIKIKLNNISFYNFLCNRIGKITAKIIYLIILFYFIIKLFYLINESFYFLRSVLFDEASVYLFLLIFLPIINALAFNKLTALARTGEILYFFIFIALIVVVFLSFTSPVERTLTTLIPSNISNTFSVAFSKTFWFGDYIFILLLFDKFSIKKQDIKRILAIVIFGIVIVMAGAYAFYTLYPYSAFIRGSAVTDMIQFSSGIGSIEKIDVIPITLVMFIIVLQGGLYNYCIDDCLEKIFVWKKYKFLLVDILLFFAATIIFPGLQDAVKLLELLNPVSLVVNYAIPIFLAAIFVLDLLALKKRRKYAKIY